MNINNKEKGVIMAYQCTKTIASENGNMFVDVSHTKRVVTLIGLYGGLSNTSISIGYIAITIELQNSNIVYHMNETAILNGCISSFNYKSYAHEIGVSVHDVAKCHNDRNYIHAIY